jgi:myo-inositol-1(or 4)-monophosphatase
MNTISISEIQAFLESAIKVAEKGGAALKKHWGKLKTISHKANTIDLVTDADKASEKAVMRYLKDKHPSHAILSEESGWSENQGAEFLWVIDPLDGTTNFTHQYPMVSVSVGLLYQGQPLIGVVYNPILKELFYAGKRLGAFFNKRKITVSATHSLDASLLATGFSYDRRTTKDNNYSEFCLMTHLSQGVRRGGSAAIDLAYVAAGRFDGYWEKGIKSWDIAAGVVLVEEAGGLVTDYDQGPFQLESGRILASNKHIHAAMSEKIHQAREE